MKGGEIIIIIFLCVIQLVSGKYDKLWEDIIGCVMPQDGSFACDYEDPHYFCTSGRGDGKLLLTECVFGCHKKFYPASKSIKSELLLFFDQNT